LASKRRYYLLAEMPRAESNREKDPGILFVSSNSSEEQVRDRFALVG
jgi:hypothetical protein